MNATRITQRTVISSTRRHASYRGPGGVECVVSLDLGGRDRLFPNLLLPSSTTEMSSTTTPSFESSSSSSSSSSSNNKNHSIGSSNDSNSSRREQPPEEDEHDLAVSCQFRHNGCTPSFSSCLSHSCASSHPPSTPYRRRPRLWMMSWMWKLHLMCAILLIVIGISHNKGSK